VRWGKSSRGSAPKRRTVLTVPEMDWIVEVLGWYLAEVRPLLAAGEHPAVWVTERSGRVSVRGLDRAFAEAREAAGLTMEEWNEYWGDISIPSHSPTSKT